MARSRSALLAGATAAAVVLAASSAFARAEADVRYTQKQTFSAALRYLRVDLAYEVTEQDPDAAYLLFELRVSEKGDEPTRGSIEVVQRDDSVRVLFRLPELPGYREELLKRGLLRKLAEEYGEPPREPAPAPDREPEGDGQPPGGAS